MPEDYKSLKGVLNTQDVKFSNNLLENFIVFYDWGFTNAGAYYNIDTVSYTHLTLPTN